MSDTDTAELVARLRPRHVADEPLARAVVSNDQAERRAAVSAYLVANNALKSEAADRLTALERERDEARAAIKKEQDAWMDIERANRELFDGAVDDLLKIKDLTAELTASQAEVERLKEDAERMDWLVSQHVEVRTPLVYGSRAGFVAQTLSDEEDAEHRTDLREQIDRARAALQPQVGK